MALWAHGLCLICLQLKGYVSNVGNNPWNTSGSLEWIYLFQSDISAAGVMFAAGNTFDKTRWVLTQKQRSGERLTMFIYCVHAARQRIVFLSKRCWISKVNEVNLNLRLLCFDDSLPDELIHYRSLLGMKIFFLTYSEDVICPQHIINVKLINNSHLHHNITLSHCICNSPVFL